MINKHVYICVSLAIVLTIAIDIYNSNNSRHPYADLNVNQLIVQYGYNAENHTVETEDGYFLTLHRIPNQGKTPILLMHGFGQSSRDFVALGPTKSLSFLLFEKGYDVWMGNARGSTWSRKHKHLNPDIHRDFWNYSMHEIGFYDAPASIDYILKTTKKQTMQYVGYSQGTIAFFVMASEKPEYNDKITLMSALAPAIFLEDPIGVSTGTLLIFRRFFEFLKVGEFLSQESWIATYLRYICNEKSIFVNVCLRHLFSFHGHSPEQVNKSELSLVFSQTPAGVAPRQMFHILQLSDSRRFQQYDLGEEENLKQYGQKKPPQYDISKVTTPVALYYASNDWTVNEKNIKRVVQEVPSVVKTYKVPLQTFNHNDFLHGVDVVKLLYNSVIDEIMKHR